MTRQRCARSLAIFSTHRCGVFASSCSQIRSTRQPSRRSVRVTRRSRALFAASFRRQNAALFRGFVACRGQPCQKQPSTKTATRWFGKTKSGLPKTGRERRQPVIWCRRNRAINASSVSLFPRPRMRAMTAERLALLKTSAIAGVPERGGEFQAPFGFVRLVTTHPVVKSRPLGIARIQLLIRQFARVRATPRLGGETPEHARPAALRGNLAS